MDPSVASNLRSSEQSPLPKGGKTVEQESDRNSTEIKWSCDGCSKSLRNGWTVAIFFGWERANNIYNVLCGTNHFKTVHVPRVQVSTGLSQPSANFRQANSTYTTALMAMLWAMLWPMDPRDERALPSLAWRLIFVGLSLGWLDPPWHGTRFHRCSPVKISWFATMICTAFVFMIRWCFQISSTSCSCCWLFLLFFAVPIHISQVPSADLYRIQRSNRCPTVAW